MTISKETITAIYNKPFNDVLYEAHTVHRDNHSPNEIQVASILSIKTGACPENCGYCSQSGHYQTAVVPSKIASVETVLEEAKKAKCRGATRFCMGASFRHLPDKALPQLVTMIEKVSALGLETCMTLGMLTTEQALVLKDAGLDFYNHNIDTSPEYYPAIVTTRTFEDRLNTIKTVQTAGIGVCCGGILGLGESKEDRISFLHTLVNLSPYPESVTINQRIPVKGTPLYDKPQVCPIELVRTIATARIIMPKAVIRLTAGRTAMTMVHQALCFFAGANSVFLGDLLLTEENPTVDSDKDMFRKLGIRLKNETKNCTVD